MNLVGAFFDTEVYAAPGDPAKIGDIIDIIQNLIRLLTPAAAIAFFAMLLLGGFRYIRAGDPKEAAAARSMLTYAIIGIILVIASWLILQLVKDVTGVNVTRVELETK